MKYLILIVFFIAGSSELKATNKIKIECYKQTIKSNNSMFHRTKCVEDL